MSSYGRIILLVAVVASLVVAAGLALIVAGRGCRAEPPPPATFTPTITSTAVLSTRQTPTSEPTSTQAASMTPEATSMAETGTATPTARISPTMTVAPTATPDLLGHHRVERGETMYGIALTWEPGRYFLWGREVWEPVCAVNPQVADCRLIYPGDVLRIPKR